MPTLELTALIHSSRNFMLNMVVKVILYLKCQSSEECNYQDSPPLQRQHLRIILMGMYIFFTGWVKETVTSSVKYIGAILKNKKLISRV